MTKLCLSFQDWWGGFPADRNYFFRLLSEKYEVTTSGPPNVVIFSAFGRDRSRRNRLSTPFRGLKVYYTGENTRPDFSECNLALTFDRLDNPKHYRLPLWAVADGPTSRLHIQVNEATVEHLVRKPEFTPSRNLAKKQHFCDFVYSNRGGGQRLDFLQRLERYRPVLAAGRLGHNTVKGLPKDGRSKLDLQRKCKFSIAFENSSHPGYVTEKIMHPFLSGSIPIYWGAPDVVEDFNPRSFINCHDYPDFDAVVEHVKEVDQDDELYLQYLSQPPFLGNQVPNFAKRTTVLKWLQSHLSFDYKEQMCGI